MNDNCGKSFTICNEDQDILKNKEVFVNGVDGYHIICITVTQDVSKQSTQRDVRCDSDYDVNKLFGD